MGVEIVLHEHDLLHLRKVRIGQILEDLGIVHGGVAIGDLDMPPAFQRREHHEQIGGSIPLILVVVPSGGAWLRRDWHTRFGDELLRRLVQADQRALWVVRSLVNLQHILHAGYERSVGIRRDDPLLLQVWPEKVFLASARSCCRWPGQRSSVPRPALPAVATSIACDPSAVRNRPRRSASLRRRRQRCAVWPRRVNTCGQGRRRSLLPPVAGASEQRCRRWYRGRRRFGSPSILRQSPTHQPSTECGPWSVVGQDVYPHVSAC